MGRYGFINPWLTLFKENLLIAARRVRTLWRQRNIKIGKGVQIASTVEYFGTGEVLVGPFVKIESGVILITEEGSLISFGAGSIIGKESILVARANQKLIIGANSVLEERIRIESVAGVKIGEKVWINRYTEILPREPHMKGKLEIGNEVHIQNHNILDICTDIIIEDNVRTGPFCAFYTHNHLASSEKLVWEQGIKCNPIYIGQGTWIGQACIVLANVQLGKNTIIAAGAVVTRSVPSGTIVGGVPAKPIQYASSSNSLRS